MLNCWVGLESDLLAIFGGYKVLIANSQREFSVGFEVSQSGGVGVDGSACFAIEIVCE